MSTVSGDQTLQLGELIHRVAELEMKLILLTEENERLRYELGTICPRCRNEGYSVEPDGGYSCDDCCWDWTPDEEEKVMSAPVFMDIDITSTTSNERIRELRDFVHKKGITYVSPVETGQLVRVLDELVHLRDQRDALQTRGTELVVENQKRRRDGLLVEELQRDAARQRGHMLLVERVALKLWNVLGDEGYNTDAGTILTEDECFVLEAIPAPDTAR